MTETLSLSGWTDVKPFSIYDTDTDGLCASGVQRAEGDITFWIEGEEFNQDAFMASKFLSIMPVVGYRVEWEED